MTTFTQELTGRRVVAGGYAPDHDACRVDRVVLVRDTIRTMYDADKRFRGIPGKGSLAELADGTSN
ncbi:hypothetical protein GHK92_15780 [Nocardioides sp. dk4132]|uniref:hypothetical protein n=1 Tax=unclassified Nocardioides TaxID=2615069 RepID=UPI001295A29A|nr:MULTISPECIES: hypothetical protein [unclassified Nocardioides]MQW77334.1 hypothetical protein [Nocardioides sp. dk4132]QGA08086.1 hypothetical protein GFH29_12250 [Nocardioides sp. dk884]